MPSVQTVEKLSAELAVTSYDFDYAADPVDVAWIDMRDVESLMVSVFRSVGTGTIDGFKLIANSEADGSGADVVIRVHPLASAPDAVGDQIFLECTAEEIAGLGSNLRYVSANLELATATDECVVTYVRKMKHKKSGNTADIIA